MDAWISLETSENYQLASFEPSFSWTTPQERVYCNIIVSNFTFFQSIIKQMYIAKIQTYC